MTNIKDLEIKIHETICRAIYYKSSEQAITPDVMYEAGQLAKLVVKAYLEEDGIKKLYADIDSFTRKD